jgi:hypothetical protein
MAATPSRSTEIEGTPGLKRSLSIWAAVGLSVALMAPSMAANINPQGSATYAGRAWLLAAVIAVIFAPRTARRLGEALAAREGIVAPGTEEAAPSLATAGDEAS